MNHEAPLMSARMGELQYSLVFGDESALDQFWDDVIAEGTPLVEPIPDDRHMLVTFVWRAHEPVTTVGIDGEVFGWEVVSAQMTRLLDTDLWYKTYRFPADLRATYMLAPHTDPLNRQPFASPHGPAMSSFSLPMAPPQPYLAEQSSSPKGKVQEHPFRSAVFNNERTIAVYTPPNYHSTGEPFSLLVLFDGGAYLQAGPTPTILDNLLAEQRLPPLVAVGIYNAYTPQREYELACNPLMVEMLQRELVPWLHERYHITHDPLQTLIGGSSYGGLAASFVALHWPERFGHAISLSGGFGWTPDQLQRDQANEPEWLARQVIQRPRLPIRFFLAVGRLETTVYDNYMPTQLTNSRHMRNVLQAKGYDVHYVEYPGAHDFIWWHSMVVEGLLALLGTPASGL